MYAESLLLAQGITDSGLEATGAYIGGGLALAGGAIGAANGDAQVGAATITGIARQPEAQGRLYTTMFLIVGLCELHQRRVHGPVRPRPQQPAGAGPAACGTPGPGSFGPGTLEYVQDVADDTTWGGAVGSAAGYSGTFSDAHQRHRGWHWAGGGYDTAMARV